MPSLTIRDLSKITLESLKNRDRSNRRSLNSEILEILDKYSVTGHSEDSDRILKEINELPKLFSGSLFARDIQKAIDDKRT